MIGCKDWKGDWNVEGMAGDVSGKTVIELGRLEKKQESGIEIT